MEKRGININYSHSNDSHWTGRQTCSLGIVSPPAPSFDTKDIYTRVNMLVFGEIMSKNLYRQPITVVMHEVNAKKDKIPRLFTWSCKLRSVNVNRYGNPYSSHLEIFVNNDDSGLVKVKMQRGDLYVLETMNVDDFLSSHIAVLLSKQARNAMLERIARMTYAVYCERHQSYTVKDCKDTGRITGFSGINQEKSKNDAKNGVVS